MLSTKSSDRTIDLYVFCCKINKRKEKNFKKKKNSSIKFQAAETSTS